jgi:hypothetical protein
MKKMLFCALAVALAACAQESIDNPLPGDPEQTADTRAANDVFNAEIVDGYGFSDATSYWVNADGDMWHIRNKGYFYSVTAADSLAVQIAPEFRLPYSEFPYACTYMCVDKGDYLYTITPKNYLIKFKFHPDVNNFYSYDEIWANAIDLTPLFPAGTVFVGMTDNPVNGHIFVSTAQGDSSDPWVRYEQQDIYRITPNGAVSKVLSNIEASIEPKNMSSPGYLDPYWEQLLKYPAALSKASGAHLWGMDCDGDIFKANATSGAVEYFTPRVAVQCFTAASGKGNPYALSGNRIVELRPAQSTDRVVGSLPATLADFTPIELLVNSDASIFYLVVDQVDPGYPGSDPVRVVYKLTLQ